MRIAIKLYNKLSFQNIPSQNLYLIFLKADSKIWQKRLSFICRLIKQLSLYQILFTNMSYYATPKQTSGFEAFDPASALERKIRQRQQLDREIQNLRNEEFSRRCQLADYHREAIPYSFRPISSISSHYMEDQFKPVNLRSALKDEECFSGYSERILKLKKQQMQLDQQKIRSTHDLSRNNGYSMQRDPIYSFHGDQYQHREEEDDSLLRKYQDGTRAQQIRNQLISYSNSRTNLKANQSNRKALARPLASDFDQAENSLNNKYSSEQKSTSKAKISAEKWSPYSKLRYQTDRKGKQKLQLFKNQAIRSPAHDQHQREAVSFGNMQKKSRSKSYHHLNTLRQKNLNNSHFSKILYEGKQGKKSQSKISHTLSLLDRSQRAIPSSVEDAVAQSTTPINQEIKNRLKVSQIVFEDSKFKNIKHEENHLHMTYDNEVKMRRQVKEKINNHPDVLRRHAMVVQ